MDTRGEEIEVVGHASGSGTISEIRGALSGTWTEIRQNPALRADAAGILGAGDAELAAQEAPPVQLQPGQQGMGIVAVAILVVTHIGTDILLGSLKNLAKDEVKRRLKRLWIEILEPAIRRRLPERGALG